MPESIKYPQDYNTQNRKQTGQSATIKFLRELLDELNSPSLIFPQKNSKHLLLLRLAPKIIGGVVLN